jgi:predicted site-specific integrase-resolvase
VINLEKRIVESAKIMEKFKERIPIIIERASSEQKLPDLDQQK